MANKKKQNKTKKKREFIRRKRTSFFVLFAIFTSKYKLQNLISETQ